LGWGTNDPAQQLSLRQTQNWLTADNGEVLTFGQIISMGSTGGNDGGSPITSIISWGVPTVGYALVHDSGDVTEFLKSRMYNGKHPNGVAHSSQ
jgi:hypothetical protein